MSLDTSGIISGAILALCGFVTMGIVSLKVAVARILEHLKIQEEQAREHRNQTAEDIKELNAEVKLIWKEVQGGKHVVGR